MYLALAIRNRGYTNKVHLRGLRENQRFLTHGGGFCLCSQASALGGQCPTCSRSVSPWEKHLARDFQSPGARYKVGAIHELAKTVGSTALVMKLLLLEYLLTQPNQEIIALPRSTVPTLYICQSVEEALKKQISQK
ncbi:hypothetical protein [Nostoc sp.]|uniref:hypothetical protein n=1 Tax=Nostoc sp. TaxID=1180 RepID=UPI002FFB3877